MNYFVIAYYALLIGGSCLAAYYQKRTPFLLLFSLTLASFIMGIIGGEGALWSVTIAAGIIALAAGTSYAFREFLVIVLPREMSKTIKTAPLTASFGLFVVMTYAIAGIFAPVIAPFSEAEVVSSAFAPPIKPCCSALISLAVICSAGSSLAPGILSGWHCLLLPLHFLPVRWQG